MLRSLGIVALGLSFSAFAATVTVDSHDDPYSAGHAFSPGAGNVVSPAATVSGGDIVNFSYISGTWSCQSVTFSGPEGTNCFISDVHVDSSNGISSFDFRGSTNVLAGVFLNDSEPADPPPAGLVFWRGSDPGIPGSIQDDFTDLFPTLNQIFFIGDGLTGQGTGTTQNFHAPAGATRLYLGFPDAGSYNGPPGAYGDNSGSVTMNVSVVSNAPEPGTIALFGTGFACVALGMRRRKR